MEMNFILKMRNLKKLILQMRKTTGKRSKARMRTKCLGLLREKELTKRLTVDNLRK